MLMPVRDVAALVGRAVRSVLDCRDDLELVVIDDGSLDGTPAAVLEAGAGDPRLVLVRSSRLGIVAALQRGLQVCRGRFVARMDGDDWCDPLRFRRQREFLEEHPDVGVVGCLVTADPMPPPGGGLDRYLLWQNSLLTHDAMYADRYVESVMSHATAMFRRDVLDVVGGWRDASWSEDLDLWLRLMAQGVVFAKIDQVWYHWTIRSEAATWTDERCSPSAMAAGKLHYLLSGPLAGRRNVLVWGTGRSLERWAEALKDLGLQVETLALDRRRIHAGKIPAPSGRPAVACYASSRRRTLVRRLAARAGWSEGRDLFFVA